jgi:hypothetical protein
METLTRLVTDSLARHGFDRPIDPRRLQWSRWFRCDSTHSLLVVPSKPGIFAIAEEVVAVGGSEPRSHNPERSEGSPAANTGQAAGILGGAALQRCGSVPHTDAASAAELPLRRMLAVLRFSEDDDMAFTLDRMFTLINPMRARLSSGKCFLRFVVIEDQDQRRSICSALNQWMLSSAEKASGIPVAFSSSVEINMAGETSAVSAGRLGIDRSPAHIAPDSGANKNLHCPQPLPSGF